MNEFSFLLQRASLFGLVALGVALLLQWLLSNRVPPAWRVWIWRAALIQTALALVPFAPIALSILPAKAPIVAPTMSKPALTEAPTIIESPVAEALTDAPVAPVAAMSPALNETPAVQNALIASANQRASLEIKLSWREFAVWIYLLGVAVQLVLLARGAFNVRRKLRACTPLDNAPLRPIAARLKIKKLPRLLQCESGSPFLVGIARPTIVLPRTLDKAHLEAVLAHELAHQRRKDLAWNTLLWALQTLLWFHPLSWLSRRFHSLEIESACDELVLQLTPIAPKSYGSLLIGAESTRPSPLTAGVNDGFFALQTRLKRLNRTSKTPRKRVRLAFGLALLVSFCAVVPVRLVARAQTENLDSLTARNAAANFDRRSQDVVGVLLDYRQKPLMGAMVYAIPMMPNDKPLKIAKTDKNGVFRLREGKDGNMDISVFADAGARGVGNFDVSGNASDLKLRLTAPTKVVVRLTDSQGRAVPDVKLSVRAVGDSIKERTYQESPPGFYQRFRAITNVNGEAIMTGLPSGAVAHLVVEGQTPRDLKDFVKDDWRGGRFAPLSRANAIIVSAPVTRKTIRLLAPVGVRGQVTQPDGSARANVKIGARLLAGSEAQDAKLGRPGVIYHARTDARGNYEVEGLRPGQYHVWIAPDPKLTSEFVGPELTRKLNGKTNRVDFQLSRGALVQGVIVSKATGKPVKGQTMWLFDSQENNQYVITDARGYFKFRALGGKQRLRVHENGSNSPPPGFKLPVQSEFNFTVKNGEKRDFKIALPGKGVEQNSKPIRGVVLSPDGKPVAGATVFHYDVVGYANGSRKVATNTSGQFVLPLGTRAHAVLMFADKGELTTPQGTVVFAGQTVTLKLAANSWASVEGRVLDEKQQPVAGAQVKLTSVGGGAGQEERVVTTNAKGAYRYDHLRSDFSMWIMASKAGYTEGWSTTRDLTTGQQARSDIAMQRAPKTLAGVLYGLDGKPVKNYSAWVTGQSRAVKVGNDGRFFFPHVPAGKVEIRVSSAGDFSEMRKWKPFAAMGGDKNVVLRLKQRQRQPNPAFKDSDLPKGQIKAESLVGKFAPPIRATQWSDKRALTLAQLRGKHVLLAFLYPFSPTSIRDYARSFPNVQVIGMQLKSEGTRWPSGNLSADEAAKKWGFPVAVDAAVPSKKASGWQTAQSYGYAPYVVIGRDGKVVYAGQKLDRAIELSLGR